MPLSSAVRVSLRDILGPLGFLDSAEDVRSYAYDLYARAVPEAVALPQTTAEASAVLRLCHAHGVAVTPRGSGTSLTGGPVPVAGGIVLCSARMNAILEISVADRLARVQAGVVTAQLQNAVAEQGMLYPPNPTSATYCTMGGNIATNAGGASGAKYGVTRDYVLGLTVVLASGEILQVGNRCQKDVAGFDLLRLMCGSEGLLGFITEISVKLIPKPEAIRTALAYFNNAHEAAAVVTDIVSHRILPCTLELMDAVFLATVAEVYQVPCPAGAGAALLLEVDGDARVLPEQMQQIAAICRQHGAIALEVAENEAQREVLWKARRGGTAALVRKAVFLVTLDYAVPISSLPAALDVMVALADKHALKVVTIAHAADGNLHPMVLYDPKDAAQQQAFEAYVDDSCKAIMALGGSISGEHGIGLEKKAQLPVQLGDTQLRLCNAIRRAFDPKGLLNPGKFPDVAAFPDAAVNPEDGSQAGGTALPVGRV